MQLPFVVGIMANLSGNVDDPNRVPLRDRKYLELDRDNFNDIMEKIAPKASINGTELKFSRLDDFSPIKVLGQIPANEDFGKRTRLSDMVAKLDGNVKLQKKFLDALTDDTKRTKMKTDLEALKAILAKQNGAISGNGGGDTGGSGGAGGGGEIGSGGAAETGTAEKTTKSKGGGK
jgi:type VI secretion system protein ImpB